MPEQHKEVIGAYVQADGGLVCKQCDSEVHQLVYSVGERGNQYTEMFVCRCGNRVKVYVYMA